MNEERVKFFETFLDKCFKLIKEQNAVAPPQPPPAVPSNPVPPGGAQNPSSPPPAQTATQEEQVTIDTVIKKLNVMRGGLSYNQPEVYGQLTTYFNSLTPEQIPLIDGFLTKVGDIVSNVPNDPPQPNNNPAPGSVDPTTQQALTPAPPQQQLPPTQV